MSYDFSSTEQNFSRAIDHIAGDISSLKTGRASVQMLDSVSVEAYGTYMKLTEVASISAPDATLLVVSPWDKTLLGTIEKGIIAANINVNPVVDKDIIRIAIAPLTEETRKDMVKRLHQKIESGRVLLRNVRTDSKKEIEDLEKTDGVSEDDTASDLDSLEKMVQKYMAKLDDIAAQKEKDLMTL